MARAIASGGPHWPPDLEAYDYVRTLSKYDRGWEYLRRNPAYHADFLQHGALLPPIERSRPNVAVYRLTQAVPRAAVWGLSTFRRSSAHGGECRRLLVADDHV
jgi:hypothetical protein